MINQVIHGDMRSILPMIETKASLVITDPPYKITKTSGSSTSSSLGHKWTGDIKACDKNAGIINDTPFESWLPVVWDSMESQSHLYVFTNDKNMNELLNAAFSCGFRLHNILVWKKNNCTPNRFYMKNCEFIAFLYKGKAFPINDYSSSHFLEYQNIGGRKKYHPTEKPVPLLERLILNSSELGGIILDPFAGSGSTLLAAKNTSRNYLGIDIDKKYVDLSNQRLSDDLLMNIL